jgi:hypothetical protein
MTLGMVIRFRTILRDEDDLRPRRKLPDHLHNAATALRIRQEANYPLHLPVRACSECLLFPRLRKRQKLKHFRCVAPRRAI